MFLVLLALICACSQVKQADVVVSDPQFSSLNINYEASYQATDLRWWKNQYDIPAKYNVTAFDAAFPDNILELLVEIEPTSISDSGTGKSKTYQYQIKDEDFGYLNSNSFTIALEIND